MKPIDWTNLRGGEKAEPPDSWLSSAIHRRFSYPPGYSGLRPANVDADCRQREAAWEDYDIKEGKAMKEEGKAVRVPLYKEESHWLVSEPTQLSYAPDPAMPVGCGGGVDITSAIYAEALRPGGWFPVERPQLTYIGPPDEIPVTPEMRSVFHAICPTGPHTVDDDTLNKAYRAMCAASPVREPIYDGGPDHLSALARERDDFRQQLAASEERTEIVLRHYHKVCARLHAKDNGIITQALLGDATYTVFASDPQTIVASPKHTPADVKPPPPPKPFPAGALKPQTGDPRRIGG
jgi:hypothetical protein